MSVAFRRESDEEHKEPRFELPIPPGPNLVTRAGFALTRARVAEFKAKVAAAEDAESRTAALRDLRYWDTRLSTAELAPDPAPGEVAFGTRVTLRLNGAERTIEIVGDDEADPAAGKIAFSAPLVRAIMGLEESELADFAGKPEAILVVKIVKLDP